MRKALVVLAFACLALSLQLISPDGSAYAFGENWGHNKCPKCGQTYKHVGDDIFYNTAGKKVYFTDHMYFVTKGTDSSGIWKGYLVARNKSNTYTYVVWHLTGIPSFKSGEDLNGKFIGYVADLDSKVSPDHIHIGFRDAPYNSSLSIKGGLPRCSHKPGGLPQYPEKFKSPYVRVKVK